MDGTYGISGAPESLTSTISSFNGILVAILIIVIIILILMIILFVMFAIILARLNNVITKVDTILNEIIRLFNSLFPVTSTSGGVVVSAKKKPEMFKLKR